MRTKRAFKVKQKTFFIIFKGHSEAKNCARLETASLTELLLIFYYNAAYPIKLVDLKKTWNMKVSYRNSNNESFSYCYNQDYTKQFKRCWDLLQSKTSISSVSNCDLLSFQSASAFKIALCISKCDKNIISYLNF